MKNKRSPIIIMLNLIKLVQNLWKIMFIAVLTGVTGFILSFGISLFATYAILSILPETKDGLKNIFLGNFSTQTYFFIMIFCGFFRGILHYLEQYCNHYIAFNILAEIRVKLFKIMRKLAPAKMEQKNQGDIVSMLTADIELLEVFYAHTISPILIAFFTSVVLFIYFSHLQIVYAIYMLFSQIIIAIFIPYFTANKSRESGILTRNKLANLNDEFLDKLRGIKEILQYSLGQKMEKRIDDITLSLGKNQKDLRNKMAEIQRISDSVIIFISLVHLLLSSILIYKNLVSIEAAILAAVLQVGSFIPYINLANLGNILSQTFASGDRVLNLIEEESTVFEEIKDTDCNYNNNSNEEIIEIKELEFKYENSKAPILKNINLSIKKGSLIGIMGESGCGKSTLLKLIMRFWNSSSGNIFIDSKNIKNIPLKELHKKFNYMTQSTNLFIGNLRDNLLVAKPDASDEEIYSALKKASFYDYVYSLPLKLDTVVEEGGKNFSGGEKQRIGLARALSFKDFYSRIQYHFLSIDRFSSHNISPI